MKTLFEFSSATTRPARRRRRRRFHAALRCSSTTTVDPAAARLHLAHGRANKGVGCRVRARYRRYIRVGNRDRITFTYIIVARPVPPNLISRFSDAARDRYYPYLIVYRRLVAMGVCVCVCVWGGCKVGRSPFVRGGLFFVFLRCFVTTAANEVHIRGDNQRTSGPPRMAANCSSVSRRFVIENRSFPAENENSRTRIVLRVIVGDKIANKHIEN